MIAHHALHEALGDAPSSYAALLRALTKYFLADSL